MCRSVCMHNNNIQILMLVVKCFEKAIAAKCLTYLSSHTRDDEEEQDGIFHKLYSEGISWIYVISSKAAHKNLLNNSEHHSRSFFLFNDGSYFFFPTTMQDILQSRLIILTLYLKYFSCHISCTYDKWDEILRHNSNLSMYIWIYKDISICIWHIFIIFCECNIMLPVVRWRILFVNKTK